jgi:hypothetical protein
MSSSDKSVVHPGSRWGSGELLSWLLRGEGCPSLAQDARGRLRAAQAEEDGEQYSETLHDVHVGMPRTQIAELKAHLSKYLA